MDGTFYYTTDNVNWDSYTFDPIPNRRKQR